MWKSLEGHKSVSNIIKKQFSLSLVAYQAVLVEPCIVHRVFWLEGMYLLPKYHVARPSKLDMSPKCVKKI